MSQIFQRQAETFLEREEAEQEDAELSPKDLLRVESPPDHSLESGLTVRITEDLELKFNSLLSLWKWCLSFCVCFFFF